jgi:hypothetical protein
MRKIGMVLTGFLLAAPGLRAQVLDSGPDRAGMLRRRIEDRFAGRVQEDLGLTDAQAGKMRETVGGWFLKRRALEEEDRRLRQELAGELRPGVAANKDNVARLTDQLLDLKIRYAETYKDEVKELAGYLDPVQRAQYLIARERLLDRIRSAQEMTDDSAPMLPRRRLRP